MSVVETNIHTITHYLTTDVNRNYMCFATVIIHVFHSSVLTRVRAKNIYDILYCNDLINGCLSYKNNIITKHLVWCLRSATTKIYWISRITLNCIHDRVTKTLHCNDKEIMRQRITLSKAFTKSKFFWKDAFSVDSHLRRWDTCHNNFNQVQMEICPCFLGWSLGPTNSAW